MATVRAYGNSISTFVIGADADHGIRLEMLTGFVTYALHNLGSGGGMTLLLVSTSIICVIFCLCALFCPSKITLRVAVLILLQPQRRLQTP